MDSDRMPERDQRHRVQLEADVLHSDGSRTPTIVSDLSLEGCNVAGWYPIGARVSLDIPSIGTVHGQVRWAIAGRAGIRFEQG